MNLTSSSLLEASRMDQTQRNHEDQAIEEARKRLRDAQQVAYERGYGSSTPEARQLIRASLQAVSDTYKLELDRITEGWAGVDTTYALPILSFEPDNLAVIVCKVAVDQCLRSASKKQVSVWPSYSKICAAIGHSVYAEALAIAYDEQDPEAFRRLIRSDSWKTKGPRKRVATLSVHFKNKDGLTKPQWTVKEETISYFKVGSWLFERLLVATGWFEHHTVRVKGSWKTVGVIKPTQALLTKLDDFTSVLHEWSWLSWPMLTPPLTWELNQNGGYLNPGARPAIRRLVASRGGGHGRTLTMHREELGATPALQALNRAQQVPYRLNETVLVVARELMTQRQSVGKFKVSEPLEVPPYTGDPDSEEELKAWKRESTRLHDENALLIQKNFQTREVLHVAEKVKGQDFWLPWFFDFRGRMYPKAWPSFVQGTDFDKSLIQFAEAGPVVPYWLAFQVATTWGLTKATMEERQKWVEENLSLIYEVGDDPLSSITLWEAADEPWQFMAACIEYTECVRDGRRTSSLPIGVDATCSGIQHLAALTQDRSAASLVNVLPTERPADAYKVVAEKANSLLPEGSPVLNRGHVKRVVMTLPYGLTRHSARDYLREEVPKDTMGELTLSELTTAVFCEAIPAVLPGPCAVMANLKAMAKKAIEGKESIVWTSPSGFVVRQAYTKDTTTRVRTLLHGEVIKSKAFNLKYVTEDVSLARHQQGIAPNFVHSLDAALLHLTFCNETRPFTLIHDCVLMRSCDINYIQQRLRREFVTMYELPLLEKFSEDIGVPIPEGTMVNTFEPREALNSPYLFC